MKKCPFCAEEIQNDAIKCRYCGEWLDEKLSGQQNRLPYEASKVESPAVSPHRQSTVAAPPTEIPKESGKVWGGIHHPWRRLFARTVDVSTLGLLPLFVVTFAAIIFQAEGAAKAVENPIIAGFIVLILWIPIEAIFLSTVGNTPAKWLFGISVRTTLGRKPSFSQALERSFRVVLQGMGLGIPFVALFTELFAYRRLTKTGTTLWDTATECVVTYKSWGTARIIGAVTVFLVFMLLATFSIMQFNAYKQRGYDAAAKADANANTAASMPASASGALPTPNLSDGIRLTELLPLPAQAPTSASARDGRFIAYNDGTVLDTKTSLMWAASVNWIDINWVNAKAYCEKYRGGGYTDWRMPTQDELAGLYDRAKTYKSNCGYDVHLTELIRIACTTPWASERRGSDAAFFNFFTGKRGWCPQSLDGGGLVLPVRSGK